MGRFHNNATAYTGSVGGLTAYKMRGSDKIIVREKYGPSKVKIKYGSQYARTRENNNEWKVCIMASRQLRNSLSSIRRLADYNYSGALNAICKKIQLEDPLNRRGSRNVLLWERRSKLSGFGLNYETNFDSVVKGNITVEADRTTGVATLHIPDLWPGINLKNQAQHPYYRLVFSLGITADIIYDTASNEYNPLKNSLPASKGVFSPWYIGTLLMPAQSLTITFDDWQDTAGLSFGLSAGLEFGKEVAPSDRRYIKYSGSTKILKMV